MDEKKKNERSADDGQSLNDEEITSSRKLSRRGLLRLAPAGLAGSALVVAGCVPAGPVGPIGPGPGRPYTGITDADGGNFADPAGYGRGTVGGGGGCTDNDFNQFGQGTDPAGQGRSCYGGGGGPVSGCTDSDLGAFADPVGQGRSCGGGGYTGLTDSDGGAFADPAGYGRRGW